MKTWTWMSALLTCGFVVGLSACGGEDGSAETGDGDGDAGDGDVGDGDEDNPHVSDFVEGGLGESGDWRGYVFTAAGDTSQIMPEEFPGDVVCAEGVLAADYEQWALVGWNIAQEIDEETQEGGAVNAIVPGGTGVAYDIVNLGSSGLRIQIQADDMGEESWCAAVPNENPGVIPWENFRKQCWMMGGEAYDPSIPLAQVGVQTFAGSETLPTSFEYCVIHLGPAD